LETTLAPVLREVVQPEITSSQDLPIASVIYRQKRADVVVVNVTSTMTTFSFDATQIVKFFTLVNNNALSCLPVGYTIC
jgi:predicted GTPase